MSFPLTAETARKISSESMIRREQVLNAQCTEIERMAKQGSRVAFIIPGLSTIDRDYLIDELVLNGYKVHNEQEIKW